MSGILNKKTRLIDLVVTELGRKAIAKERFNLQFASFTDKDCFYSATDLNLSGAKNATNEDRIYLEANTKSDIDQIVLTTDDSGLLFINSQNLTSGTSVIGNKIFEENPEKKSLSQFITGTVFNSASNQIIKTSIKNFEKNRFLGTKTDFNEGNDFVVSTVDNKNFFNMTNSSPFLLGVTNKITTTDNADPLLFDNKLAHFKNFQYLPPVNTDGSSYGQWQDLRSTTRTTFKDIKNSLRIQNLGYDYLQQNDTVINEIGYENLQALNRKPLASLGTNISKERIEAYFEKSSTLSNVITQIYEKDATTGKLNKLEIVDAGEFIDDEDSENKIKRVFYVGKVVRDNNGFATFLNVFTVIWD